MADPGAIHFPPGFSHLWQDTISIPFRHRCVILWEFQAEEWLSAYSRSHIQVHPDQTAHTAHTLPPREFVARGISEVRLSWLCLLELIGTPRVWARAGSSEMRPSCHYLLPTKKRDPPVDRRGLPIPRSRSVLSVAHEVTQDPTPAKPGSGHPPSTKYRTTRPVQTGNLRA